MDTNAVKVDHKVRFVGSYFSDSKLTDNVVHKMVLHSAAQRGHKVKLRLCMDGIRLIKPLFATKLRESSFFPIKDILNIGRHVSNPFNILCVVDNTTTPYMKVVMFRCSSESDAAEYAETFSQMRKGLTLNGPHITGETHDANPHWMTITKEKSNLSKSKRSKSASYTFANNNDPVIYREKSTIIESQNNNNSATTEDLVASTTVSESKSEVVEDNTKSNSHSDPVYAQVRKRTKKDRPTVIDDNVVDGKVVDGHVGVGKEDHTVMTETHTTTETNATTESKSVPTTEELQREIRELRTLLTKSMSLNDKSPSTENVDMKHTQPLHIDLMEKHTAVESAPASVRSFKQDNTRTNSNQNNSTALRNSRETHREYHSVQGNRSHQKVGARHSSSEAGESRIVVNDKDFRRHYGTVVPAQSRVLGPAPSPSQHNPRMSTMSERSYRSSGYISDSGLMRDSGPMRESRAMSYHASSSALPTRLALPVDPRDSGFQSETNTNSIGRSNTLNTSAYSQTMMHGKVQFDPKPVGRGSLRRIQFNDTVVKPIEKVYATQTTPRGVVYVNNGRVLRQSHDGSLRYVASQPTYVTSQPTYVTHSGEVLGEVRRPDSVR